MLDEVGVPGSMKIGVAAPRQSDLDQIPTAVIVVSGMEGLVDVADEVGQNPDGELLVRLGLARVSKNISVASNCVEAQDPFGQYSLWDFSPQSGMLS